MIDRLKCEFARCGVPAATGAVVGLFLAKIGIGVFPLAMLGTAGVMYSKGYRLCLVKPVKKPAAPETAATPSPEPPQR